MSGPGSYTKGMPSRGQKGGAMNDSLAQQPAQTPSPSTGSRQATHSVGNAMSSASFAARDHAPPQAFSAPQSCEGMERVGEGSASMGARVSSGLPILKLLAEGCPCRYRYAWLAQESRDLHHPSTTPDHHAASSFPARVSNRSFQAAPAAERSTSRLGDGMETTTGRFQNREHPLCS